MTKKVSSIIGRHIILRPFLTNDLEDVFTWRSDTADLHLWFQRPEILSWEEFVDDFGGFLRSYIHIIMMIEAPSSDSSIGMIYSYKPDYLNGHVFLCAYLKAKCRQHFYGAEAGLLFIDYLFSYFPFRKLYGEVYEHNTHSLNNLVKGGWIEEGRLRKHRWHLNNYEDMLILALYREDFYDRFGKLLSSIKTVPYRQQAG
jgi:RimJ/RimL family protein N-acetyltransferase